MNKVEVKKYVFIMVECLAIIMMLVIAGLSGKKSMNYLDGEIKEKDLSYVSVYFDSENALLVNEALELEYKYKENMREMGNDESTYYKYGYSAEEKLIVERDKKSVKADATIVGKDFFDIHSIKMISGEVFNPDEKNLLVIVNSKLAWELYGSKDIVGKKISVSGVEYTIAGVYEANDYDMGAEKDDKIFSVYIGAADMCEKNSQIALTNLEIVANSPVKHYLENFATDFYSTKKADEAFKVIDNTERFSFVKRLSNIKNISKNVIDDSTIKYSKWENYIRTYEQKVLLIDYMIIACLCSLVVFVLISVSKKK